MITDRVLSPIKRKIFNLIGRGILSLVDNSLKTQRIQLSCLKDETLSEVERLEEYGFTTYPLTESEPLVLFFNGDRTHGLCICVNDRRYRPLNLQEGEVCIYTSQDQTSGHRIHFKQDGIINKICTTSDNDISGDKTEDIGGNLTINLTGNETKSVSGSFTITINGDEIRDVGTYTVASHGKCELSGQTVDLVGPSITINGTTVIGGGSGGKALATEDLISIFNSHTHPENGDGGGITSPPMQTISSSNFTSKVKAV
jgi:phage baseplate assembly protein V